MSEKPKETPGFESHAAAAEWYIQTWLKKAEENKAENDEFGVDRVARFGVPVNQLRMRNALNSILTSSRSPLPEKLGKKEHTPQKFHLVLIKAGDLVSQPAVDAWHQTLTQTPGLELTTLTIQTAYNTQLKTLEFQVKNSDNQMLFSRSLQDESMLVNNQFMTPEIFAYFLQSYPEMSELFTHTDGSIILGGTVGLKGLGLDFPTLNPDETTPPAFALYDPQTTHFTQLSLAEAS